MVTYSVSQTLAEKALWKFAEEHELNLVTSGYPMCASCFYSGRIISLTSCFTVGQATIIGPLTPGFLESAKPEDTQALTTSIFMCIQISSRVRPLRVGMLALSYFDARRCT